MVVDYPPPQTFNKFAQTVWDSLVTTIKGMNECLIVKEELILKAQIYSI